MDEIHQQIALYLSPSEVRVLVNEAKRGRHGLRDALLIDVLFQSALRVSEVLSLTPSCIDKLGGWPVLQVVCKGRKLRTVSIPEPIANRLQAYALDNKLGPQDRFFKINRFRVWQIIKKISMSTGLNKRIYPHLFRHSSAIERMKQGQNFVALQFHLGHSSMEGTAHYLKMVTQEDAIRVQGEVQFD